MTQNTMTDHFDIAIVGAGPAGMSAAINASDHGLSVVVLDEQPEPGGQIYRAAGRSRPQDWKVLGSQYRHGKNLVDRFHASEVTYWPGSTVWEINSDKRIAYSRSGQANFVGARKVVLATGAVERPMPIGGWTLPGVMTVGGAQTMIKASASVPDGRFALAGTGPLLLLTAAQLVKAGAKPVAILDTTSKSAAVQMMKNPKIAMLNIANIAKGLSWFFRLRLARIPIYSGAQALAAFGDGRIEGVSFSWKGRKREIDLDLLLLHQGVTPNINLAASMGCEMAFNNDQKCWEPKTDARFRTSHPDVYIVGDGAGILGANAAETAGYACAFSICHDLGVVDQATLDKGLSNIDDELKRERDFRTLLDVLYTPETTDLVPRKDDDVVCRCEEVTLGQLRSAIDAGCNGINQLKFFTRCGMGPCQGRNCSLTAMQIMAQTNGLEPATVGYMRLRSPVKPVALGEIAALHERMEGKADV